MYEGEFFMFSFLITLFTNFMALIGYMSNLNSFPKPLSAKEERELLKAMENGDEDAKNTLIEKNLRLVAYVSKKYYQVKDSEDLISIGTIGLIKAVNSFNKDKGIRLATYAVRCIENEILMCLRSEKKLVNEVSINEPIGYDYEGNEINLMDVLTDEDESVFKEVDLKINTEKLYKAIDSILEDREKEIIELRYAINKPKSMTQKEIAKMLGISRSYVSRIEKKALEKLEKYLNGI